jgi:hypothetical protein
MHQAKIKDKAKVVNIIAKTFLNNPGVNWMFSEKGNRKKKIKRLADYAFIKCHNRNGVLVSTNGKGVALYYRSDKTKFSLREIYYEIRFGLFSIDLLRLKEVLQRESNRKSRRPKNEPYYYFWFLGVLKEGAKAGFELNNGLINIAKKEHIPIYLETSEERNKLIYERIGYETYDYWQDDAKDIKFWFMKMQFN